jgi:carbon monoxide dehydrogenase subunit G
MGTGNASVSIDRPADDVWALVGDFGGIGEWMPGIDACRLQGEDRVLDTMGMTITERLVKKDDAARALTYSIVDGAPVERHEAVITVVSDGQGSRVTWDVEALPDDMAGLMASVYQGALDALKTHLEQ